MKNHAKKEKSPKDIGLTRSLRTFLNGENLEDLTGSFGEPDDVTTSDACGVAGDLLYMNNLCSSPRSPISHSPTSFDFKVTFDV